MAACKDPRTASRGQPRVLIVGASARWAAESASRAGWTVVAADRFADQDLRAVCRHWLRWNGSAPRLHAWLANHPFDRWMYLGGLEHRPHLIEAIGRGRRLAGTPPEALDAVRHPRRWADLVRRAGWSPLPVCLEGESPPQPTGAWLEKPLRGAGGGRYRLRKAPRHRGPPPGHFWQAFWEAPTFSAAFLTVGGCTALLGVARQWTPRDDLEGRRPGHRPPFTHCGLRWLPEIPSAWKAALEALGETVTAAVPMHGLWGVDFLARGDELRAVECNPRPTASMELAERAEGGRPLLADHLAPDAPIPRHAPRPARRPVRECAKRIVYAPAACDAAALASAWAAIAADFDVAVKDIPATDASIWRGQPVVTLIAEGDAWEDVKARLLGAEDAVEKLIRQVSKSDLPKTPPMRGRGGGIA